MMIIIAKDGAIRKYSIHEHTDCKRICLVSLCISVRRNNDFRNKIKYSINRFRLLDTKRKNMDDFFIV